MRTVLLFSLVLAACGDPKLFIGVHAGAAGADVARMAVSEVRQSRAAKDRWVDIKIAAMRAVAAQTATPEMLAASLDSMIAQEKIAVVISRFLDEPTLGVARTFQQRGMPFLAITPLPDGTLTQNGYGFSLVPGMTKQARFLAEQALPGDRIAIVHIDDSYGNTLATALQQELGARGLKPVDVRSYKQSWDEPRMVALGTDVEKTKDPSLVYFLGRAPSLELVWQPFREAGKGTRVLGSDLVESTALYTNNEGRFTGLRYVRYLDPQSADPRMKDLHDRYWLWLSRGEMTGEGVLVYDGIMLIREALASGARTRDEFKQYFASIGKSRPPFNGVGGPISFDDQGEVARPFQLAEVTSDGIKPVVN